MTQAQIEQILKDSVSTQLTLDALAIAYIDIEKAAAAILEALPSPIPVNERLPQDRQRVLFWYICNKNNPSVTDVDMGVFLKKDQWDRENMFCNGAFFDLSWITHWMPAPDASLPLDLK